MAILFTEVHSGQKGNAENVNVLYPMIVNADGVYLATYTALLLNLKLIHANYYDGLSRSPPLTEVSSYIMIVIIQNSLVS